jgi:hypothetical protein
MTAAGTLALLLVASPLAIFIVHSIAYRAMQAAGRRPTAHTSAIAAIAFCFVVVLLAGALLTWSSVGTSWVTAACACLYIAATYAAMSILYLDVVNIAETSLHMHLLLEIAWNDRLSLERLTDKYNPVHMVAERLERLAALGQVRRDGDRYVLGNRSALRLAKTMDVWRRIIGLPTTPDEALSRR